MNHVNSVFCWCDFYRLSVCLSGGGIPHMLHSRRFHFFFLLKGRGCCTFLKGIVHPKIKILSQQNTLGVSGLNSVASQIQCNWSNWGITSSNSKKQQKKTLNSSILLLWCHLSVRWFVNLDDINKIWLCLGHWVLTICVYIPSPFIFIHWNQLYGC